jgi:hypothetical protein
VLNIGTAEPVSFSSYPNPVKDYIYILSDKEIGYIDIISPNGLPIRHYEVNAFGSTLNVSGLIPGIYLINVCGANLSVSRLIIKN